MKRLMLLIVSLLMFSCSDNDRTGPVYGPNPGHNWGNPYFEVVDNSLNKLTVKVSGAGYGGVRNIPVYFNATSVKYSIITDLGSSGGSILVKALRNDGYELLNNSLTVDGAMNQVIYADVNSKVSSINFDIPAFTGNMSITIECYSRDGVILP